MFVFVSPLTCGTGPGSHRWWWRQLSPMVSAELNMGRRQKGSEITTALNQGATNQEHLFSPCESIAMMVLTFVPHWAFGQCLTNGFGSLLCQEGKSWGFQATRNIWKESWESPLSVPFPLEHATAPSFYIWERGGPGRGSRYIRVKRWSTSSLNKLQWFSSLNLKPLFGCFRENKCNALCVMQEADLTFLDITFL